MGGASKFQVRGESAKCDCRACVVTNDVAENTAVQLVTPNIGAGQNLSDMRQALPGGVIDRSYPGALFYLSARLCRYVKLRERHCQP